MAASKARHLHWVFGSLESFKVTEDWVQERCSFSTFTRLIESDTLELAKEMSRGGHNRDALYLVSSQGFYLRGSQVADEVWPCSCFFCTFPTSRVVSLMSKKDLKSCSWCSFSLTQKVTGSATRKWTDRKSDSIRLFWSSVPKSM